MPIPLSHGIAGARDLADGASLSSVWSLLGREVGVAAIYVLIGVGMLRFFEAESRRHATLEIA